MKQIIILSSFILSILLGQIPSLETLQNNVIAQFDQIEDYRVDIKIGVKMTGFRMPRKKIRLYYKKPGKMKIEADGFAIMPKIGMGGNPSEYFNMLTDIIDISSIQLDGSPFYKITGHVDQDSIQIPMAIHQDDSLNVRMDVLIDANKWTINQVAVSLNDENLFIFETTYTEILGIYVPEKSEFKLGLKGISQWSARNPFGGPTEDRTDFEALAKKAGVDPDKDEFSGNIIMTFSKYRLNKGLKDKLLK